MFERTAQLLRQQLEGYAGAWSQESLDELTPQQLAAQLRVAIALYHSIFVLHEDLGPAPHPGQRTFDHAKAIEVEQLYQLWDVPSRMIWRRVTHLLEQGNRIESADEFRTVYLDVGSQIGVSIDQILEAQQQLREGKKIPHAEVVNGVRRRMGA
jgi:hypothetical protein